MNKPFRPPLLIKPLIDHQSALECVDITVPAARRRRINENIDEPDSFTSLPRTASSCRALHGPRKPLIVIKNPIAANATVNLFCTGLEGYYTVLWRKYTTKKIKTWDGDGILSIHDGYAHLQDISGREIGKTMWKTPLLPGSTLSVGGKDVEVDTVISKADFLAGRPFLHGVRPKLDPKPEDLDKHEEKPRQIYSWQEKCAKRRKDVTCSENTGTVQKSDAGQEEKRLNMEATKSNATKARFKNPVLSSTVMPNIPRDEPQPRHDPNQKDALVMRRPASVPKGKRIVDVIVDPFICRNLREHQRQGVQFMYECVMGMRAFDGEGAILADDMGLGKTLQTIALLWTLLKQNPIYEDPPVIKKALIVCPVTLIDNWRKEFRKWLGIDRIGVFVVDDKKRRLTDFTMGKSYSVMIIGYEKLRLVQDDLRKGAGIDIVIADEGHRLKTAGNKSALAIKSLNTARRIILSGTTIQNDLSEFYVTVDFVNPGLLGKASTFKKEFEDPIVKSRQHEATPKDIEKGDARRKELASLTDMFILRRTIDILSKYLPPKTECVLFCRLTSAQASVYRHVLASPVFGAVLGNTECALQLINILKKVCNSPSLLKAKERVSEDGTKNETIASLLSNIPANLLKSPGASGKIQVLDSLLHRLRTTTTEKVVLVSNYTSTLDILQNLVSSLSYSWLRLDGSTPASKRQDLVDRFNRSDADTCFAFLLSAKAGGTGLNLTGASRLVLFDVDWNPSTDLQAMARIHRDGQKRHCRIYRLLTMGALDEKIWQRQIVKVGLAESVLDRKGGMSSFSREELRALFSLEERTAAEGGCRTHELLGCGCGGSGELPLADDDPLTGNGGDEDGADGRKGEGENGHEDEDEEDLPEVPALIKASQVNIAEQEQRIKERAQAGTHNVRKEKKNVLALMQYRHFDTNRIKDMSVEEVEDVVGDDVLGDVLREEGSKVGFIFAKTSGGGLELD